MKGFILAAPASNSGKTTIMLGLLHVLARCGQPLMAAKAGPDYIDADFHRVSLGGAPFAAAAAAETSLGNLAGNLDCWAMRPALLRALAGQAASAGKMLCVEAMMGLYDGAADGSGSAADLARLLRLPVILAVDCSKFSQSVAALAHGFCAYAANIKIAGLILNKVGSARHAQMLRAALEQAKPPLPPILGIVYRDKALLLPERHLGLVQAAEHSNIKQFIITAAEHLGGALDWPALLTAANAESAAAKPEPLAAAPALPLPLPLSLPLRGRHIAIAYDHAFRFIYPHQLAAWRQAGRRLSFFSPLADEAPAAEADCVFLPGGYPELFAAKLAAAKRFKAALAAKAGRGAHIYGECGGYMALGRRLRDKAGESHAMLGLLPIETDFQQRRLSLGYRRLAARGQFFGAAAGAVFRGHEFHYATFSSDEQSALRADKTGQLQPLWHIYDSQGKDLGAAGLQCGAVGGSFIHIIDCEA